MKNPFRRNIILNIIIRAPGNPGADLAEIFAGVQAFYCCCAEFKGKCSGEQPLNRFSDGIHIRDSSADSRIMLRSGFNIHGNIVQQSLLCQMAENLRTASVCIQLDAQSQAADLEDKLFQSFRLKTGLASADADSIKNPAPLFKKARTSSGEYMGSASFPRISLLWQKGQRKLQPPVKIVAATYPG